MGCSRQQAALAGKRQQAAAVQEGELTGEDLLLSGRERIPGSGLPQSKKEGSVAVFGGDSVEGETGDGLDPGG